MGWTARLIDAEEKDKYNAFVAGSRKGHILQSFEWGEVKAETGWTPLRLVVEDDDQIVASISLLERGVPVVGSKIFYAPRGPVLDYANRELFDFLLASVKDLASERGVFVFKVDPDVPSDDAAFEAYLGDKGFRALSNRDFEGIQPSCIFRLDISPDLDTLFANLHSKTRYNIRLAQRKGVSIKSDCTRNDLRPFYDILTVTAKRDKFLVRSFDYFETLWDHLVENGLAKLFLAEYEGDCIAGTLAFIFGSKAWYIYGASANHARNTMPNYLLQWTMIEWAREQGCSLYDFRGVPGNLTPDNPLYGLYRFKKGFQGDYVELVGEFDLPYSPSVYWAYRTLEPVYSRGARKLIRMVRGRARSED